MGIVWCCFRVWFNGEMIRKIGSWGEGGGGGWGLGGVDLACGLQLSDKTYYEG